MAAIPTAKHIPVGAELSLYWISGSSRLMENLHVPAIATVLYLAMIFGGQMLMKDRKPLPVKPLMILWNVLLAAFSIIGAYFYVPELLRVIQSKGLHYEMCSFDSEITSPWVYLFCLSKIPELVDTFWLVVRKRPVIFLHGYHHVTVMWFCWYAWGNLIENGGIFAAMNLTVHSIMYTYYAIAMSGVRFPQPIRLSITLLQIIQMAFGTAFVAHNIIYCNFNPLVQYAGLIMYLSYGALFLQFFITQYCRRSKSKDE